MKNHLVVVGIAVLLIFVGFSGCIEDQSDYVTIQGILIACPAEENNSDMAMFYIIQGLPAESWFSLWNNVSVAQNSSEYGPELANSSVFILTRNRKIITEEYDDPFFIEIFFIELDGKYGYLDEIKVRKIRK